MSMLKQVSRFLTLNPGPLQCPPTTQKVVATTMWQDLSKLISGSPVQKTGRSETIKERSRN
jgi:hypothetical protein